MPIEGHPTTALTVAVLVAALGAALLSAAFGDCCDQASACDDAACSCSGCGGCVTWGLCGHASTVSAPQLAEAASLPGQRMSGLPYDDPVFHPPET